MSGSGRLLTREDLGRRWADREGEVLDARTVTRICERLGLRAVRLGHRTVRYRPEDVEEAELAAQEQWPGRGGREGRGGGR